MALESVLLRRFPFVCAVALAVSPIIASTPGQEATALTRELMSPFCPGLLLSDCQSAGARELRAEIRRRFEAGESKTEIVDDLVLRFGPGLRGQPEPRGIGAVAWAIPLLLATATFLGLVWRLRAATARVRQLDSPLASATEDPLVTARIEDELHAMD